MSWADKQLKKHKLRKQIKEIMDSPKFQKERQKELDKHTAEAMNYKHYNEWWENKYVPGEPEGTLTVEYLLEPGYKHLHNCKTNQTALIRKLMEVQRNGQ